MFKFLNKGISAPLAITIVVVLAVFVGGGILTYQYWWMSKEEVEKPIEKTQEKITEDETVDWKIHRNEEYGFEIKYPDKWKMRIGRSWRVDVDDEENEIYGLIDGKINEEQYDCAFEILMNKKIPNPKTVLEGSSVKFEDKEDIFIGNNLSATKFSNYEYPDSGIYLLKDKNNKGYYFKIAISGRESFPGPVIIKEHKCGKVFNQMLSTFRFID